MRKYAIAGFFWLALLFMQVVISACSCQSFFMQYFFIPNRVDVYSVANAEEQNTLGIDWVKRNKEVSGSKVRVAFVANYRMREKSISLNGGLINAAYADCLPDYYEAGDTVLTMDVITMADLEGGISAGQSILEHVGWTGERVDSLKESINFGFSLKVQACGLSWIKSRSTGNCSLKAL